MFSFQINKYNKFLIYKYMNKINNYYSIFIANNKNN